jgi:uncharacterized protein YlaI
LSERFFKTALKAVLKPELENMCPDCKERYEKKTLAHHNIEFMPFIVAEGASKHLTCLHVHY